MINYKIRTFSLIAVCLMLFTLSAKAFHLGDSKEDSLINVRAISLSKSNILPKLRKKIKWKDDDGVVDCISFSVKSEKSQYSVGEKVKLTLSLEYIEKLNENWRQNNCSNFALKIVFPENFIQTGGNYTDLLIFNLSRNNRKQDVLLEGFFISKQNENECFTILKGPENSNSETIFIKKATKCLKVDNNFDKIIAVNPKLTLPEIPKFNETPLLKKNDILNQFLMASTEENPVSISILNDSTGCNSGTCDTISVCFGESKTIAAGGCENADLLWSTGETNQEIIVSPTASGSYSVSCINGNDTLSMDAVYFIVKSDLATNYDLNITGPDSVCAGSPFQLIANGCPSNSSYLYKISTGVGVIEQEGDEIVMVPSPQFSGAYRISVKCINVDSCSSTESAIKTIHVIQPGSIDSVYITELDSTYNIFSLSSSINNSFCVGDSVKITVSGCNGQIIWADNSISATKTIVVGSQNQTINYICKNGDCERSGNFVFPAGTVKLNTPQLVFDYEAHLNTKAAIKSSSNSITLKASGCQSKYLWWDGETTQNGTRIFDISQQDSTTIYSVKCTNFSNNCQSDSSSVGIYMLSMSSTKDSLCFGDSTVLTMNGCINGLVRWFRGNETSYFAGGNNFQIVNEINSPEEIYFYGKCITPYLDNAIQSNYIFNSDTTKAFFKSVIQSPVISTNSSVLFDGQNATLTSTGCIGQTIWSNGMTGNSIQLSANDSLKISALCLNNGCFSAKSNELTIFNSNYYKPKVTLLSKTDFQCYSKILIRVEGCPGNNWNWHLYGSNGNIIQSTAHGGYIQLDKDISQDVYSVVRCRNSSYVEFGIGSTMNIQYNKPQNIQPYILSNKVISRQMPGRLVNSIRVCQSDLNSTYLNASGCNGTVVWRNSAGTIFSNDSLIYIGNYPSSFFTNVAFASCIRNGCESTKTNISLSLQSSPGSPIINSNINKVCQGDSVVLSANVPSAYTLLWFDGTQFRNDQAISKIVTKVVYPNNNYDYRSRYYSTNNGCSSVFSNQPLIEILSIPEKANLTSDKTQICGPDSITISSTNCDGTLTINWKNDSGQSGTFSNINQLKTFISVPTSYIAKCTNSCGTSATWSDSLKITSYKIQTPNIYSSEIFGSQIPVFSENCEGGEVIWSNGMTGNQIEVNIDSTIYLSAICKINNCISDSSNTVELKSCEYFKPTLQLISEEDACSGLAKNVDIKALNSINHQVNWKVEDVYGKVIYQKGRYSTYFSDAIEHIYAPQSVFVSAKYDGCSLWSDKYLIEVTGSGIQRPNLEVLNHQFTGDSTNLFVNLCTPTQTIDSVNLFASNGVNELFYWHIGNYNSNDNVSFWGDGESLEADYGNYTNYETENSLIYPANPTLFLDELSFYSSYETSVYAFNVQEGCISFPARVNIKQIPQPSKPWVGRQNIEKCPGSINYLEGSELGDGSYLKWFNDKGDEVDVSNGVTPLVTTSYYAVRYKEWESCSSPPSDSIKIEIYNYKNLLNISSSDSVSCGEKDINLSLTGCPGFIRWYNTEDLSNISTGPSVLVRPSVNTNYYASCYLCDTLIHSDTISVTVAQPIPPVISVTKSVICNSASIRENITFTATGCNGTVVWSDGNVGNTFTKNVSETVIYSAKCVIGSCESELSNLIQITVLTPPLQPILSADNTSKCQGDSSEISILADACNGNLLWNNGLTSSTILVNPFTTTTYSVTCTNTCGVSEDSLTIFVDSIPPTPQIILLSSTVCRGEDLTMVVQNCPGNVFWFSDYGDWFGQDTLTVFTDFSVDYHAICYSQNANCVSDTGSFYIEVNDYYPEIVVSNENPCFGESVTFSAPSCISDIEWEVYVGENDEFPTIANTPSISISADSVISINLTCKLDICSGLRYGGLDIYPSKSPNPIEIIADNDTLCIGSGTGLYVNSCNGDLLWSTGETEANIFVNPTSTTTYFAKCTTLCDSTFSSITIVAGTSSDVPVLVAESPTICRGETAKITVENCPGQVIWINENPIENNGQYYFIPDSSITYSAYCNNNGCITDTTEIFVQVNNPLAPILSVLTSNPICPGSDITLEVINCNGNIYWSDGYVSTVNNQGIGRRIVEADLITTYSITCSAIGCSAVVTSNTLNIEAFSSPTLPYISYSDNIICSGNSVNLFAWNCNGSLLWSTGDTTASITVEPTETTTYSVSCNNICGTSDLKSTLIEVTNYTAPSLQAINTTICPGGSTTITATNCQGEITWFNQNGNTISEGTASIEVSPIISTTYSAICGDTTCFSSATNILITVQPLSSQPIISTNTGITAVCRETSITLTASGCEYGSFLWSTGESTQSIISSPDRRALGQEFPYTVSCIGACETLVSDTLKIKVAQPTRPVLEPALQEVCVGQSYQLNVSTVCENGFLEWRNEDFPDFTINPTLVAEAKGTYRYRVRCVVGPCNSPYSETIAVVKVYDVPEVSLSGTTPVLVGKALNITAVSSAKTYQWTGPNNFSSSNKNVRINPTILANGGIYSLTASNGGNCTVTSTIAITIINEDCGCSDCDQAVTINPKANLSASFGQHNYTVETTYLEPHSTIPNSMIDAIQSVSYFDGLGRPTENISLNVGGGDYLSQNQKDIVTFMKYDALGREVKKYLPFAATENNGLLINIDQLINKQINFYNTQTGKSSDATTAFSETKFENSPLNRILEQGSPGVNNQLSTGHVKKMIYTSNTKATVNTPNGNPESIKATLLNNVKMFYFESQSSDITTQQVKLSYYDAHELSATIMEDENGHLSVEFKDKDGQVVCKRVHNQLTQDGVFSADEFIETNYIYNDFGQLSFVFQPMASVELNTTPENTTITPYTAQYNNFVFFYEYDTRGRMVRKRVPGMNNFVVSSYDNRDRLISTLDANDKVTRMDYDGLNRPIRTYLKNNTNDTEKLVSESFYDNYNQAGNKTFNSTHGFNQPVLSNTIGLSTVSKIAVMDAENNIRLLNGNPQYLSTVTYYDDLGRPIQTQTDNIQGLTEISSSELDFTGRAKQTRNTVNYVLASGSKTMETLGKTTYDQGGRVAAVCQKIDNDGWQPIARNNYSPLGELNRKQLGCDIQNVDYQYNIKGWLTKINNVDAEGDSYKNTKDLFAMRLNYDGDFTGNITSQVWRTMDQITTNRNQMTVAAKQQYNYTYDYLNRLLTADYSSSDAALAVNGISTRMFTQGGQSKAYDLNGNILKMIRNVNNQPVDNLTYAYTNNNRLDAVTETLSNTDKRYFNELNNTTDDYTYDAMGNMIVDKNKGVTEIKYNQANLPTSIVRNNTTRPEDSGRMKYYYSAMGQKLMTEVATNPSPGANIDITKTRIYLNSMVIKGGEIEFIGTPEGRALTLESVHKDPDGTVSLPNYVTPQSDRYRYEYQLKDHLGNLRVACRCGDPIRNNQGKVTKNSQNREPIRIVQQNNYDPWGLDFGSPSVSSSGTPPGVVENLTHRFQYNSKERIQDLGIEMYDFGARHYDGAIGRWSVVDPLAHKYPAHSLYSYCLNNPIIFVDPDGADVIPSKVFLNTSYGKVFQDLRTNNAAFQKTISKYENNKNFNLSLGVNNAKVKSAGAVAITETPVDKTNISKSADIASFYLSSTTVPSNSDYKFTNIGVVLIVGHEAVHQKIALTTKSEDDTHNTYNTERQSLVNILTEYNKDNNLGLSTESITALSYSGQLDSRDFKSYINGLAKENGTTYKDEKAKYEKLVSDLIYEKKEK